MSEVNSRHTFGRVRDIPDDVEETRTVPFVLSNGEKDRHRTRMNMDNWVIEHYNANPIVGYQHTVYGSDMCNKPDPDDVIGTGRVYLRDGLLLSKITFETESINPQAEKVFQKVTKSKSLRALSVGITPIGGGTLINEENGNKKEMDSVPWQVPKGHVFDYEGQELLEQSVVNIPSNRQALKRALRSQTANALSYIKRVLGGKYSFGDIEKMTVGNLLTMIDKDEYRVPDESDEQEVRDVIDDEEKSTDEESQSTVNHGLLSKQLREVILKQKAINLQTN